MDDSILRNSSLSALLPNASGSSLLPDENGSLFANSAEADQGQVLLNTLESTMQCICSDLQHEDYSPLYAWFNYIVIIIMLPSLSVFGVLTNFVNVFIFSRKRMNNSANTYLLFLSCSDFMVIVTGLFIFWIDSARSYIPELVHAPYTTVYTLPFGYMAQTCSIYFTVAAAFDCFVSVCCKRSSHRYCTPRRARQVVGSIVLCAVLYNSLRFPQFSLRKCSHDGSQELVVEICPTSVFFAINTVYNVYMYMVLMTLLPFLLLFLFNALIIIQKSIDQINLIILKRKQAASCPALNHDETASLRKGLLLKQPQERIVSEAKAEKCSTVTAQRSNSLSTPASGSVDDTITMIMVVVLFLTCNTLALIVNLIETFFNPDALLLNLLSDASNFLVIFNSSVNCVIYMIFNKEYREVFLIHFIKFKQYFRNVRQPHNGESPRNNVPLVNCASAERYLYKSPNRISSASSTRDHLKQHPEHLRPLELNGNARFAEHSECEGEKCFCSTREINSPVWMPSSNTPWILATNLTEEDFRQNLCLDEYVPQNHRSYMAMPNSETQQSFDPSNSELLLMDDDSGWDESVSNMVVSTPTRLRNADGLTPFSNHQHHSYLAEVKILKDESDTLQPHIYVRPISTLCTNNNSGENASSDPNNTGTLSVTAL